MIEIDLRAKATTFAGDPIYADRPDATLAFSLALLLGEATTGPAAKFIPWMHGLYTYGTITVDEADWKTLYDYVKEYRTAMKIKGPIEMALDAAKDAADKAK